MHLYKYSFELEYWYIFNNLIAQTSKMVIKSNICLQTLFERHKNFFFFGMCDYINLKI